jgi:hypothetical protein
LIDVDLEAQQNDEPAKDGRSLAPPECRPRDRDKGYPAVNRADALFAFCVDLGMERWDRLFVARARVLLWSGKIFPLNSIAISVNTCYSLRLEIK